MRGAAEAGADGVVEDEVGVGEEGLGVIEHACGCEAAGAEDFRVDEDGAGGGAAVPEEGEGAGLGGFVQPGLDDVGDEEAVASDFAGFVVANRETAGAGLVLEIAGDGFDVVLGDDDGFVAGDERGDGGDGCGVLDGSLGREQGEEEQRTCDRNEGCWEPAGHELGP